jgi:hypothetical protein
MTADLSWSDWVDLRDARRHSDVPRRAGLYRIRRCGTTRVDYLGQTGRTLRERLAAACCAYDAEMPYSDPHVAAPGLWALLRTPGCAFEVSTAVYEGSVHMRKGLEALEISRLRIEQGCSPTLNFGRMPDGWRKSTGNNRRLIETGKRLRGAPDPTQLRTSEAPPPGTLDGDPFADDWLDLSWSRWSSSPAPSRTGVGLYRARIPGQPRLLYIGQGLVASRIANHRRRPDRYPPSTTWSWASTEYTLGAQLLEQENDLIASHMLVLGEPPTNQFLGATSSR